nr:hypothetical protein [Tanacetum cinerariifolium]
LRCVQSPLRGRAPRAGRSAPAASGVTVAARTARLRH